MPIKETNNYILKTGIPVNSSKEESGEVYQIINKSHGVVEVETTMLPQAIKYLHDLEAGLAAVQDMFEENSTKDAKILPIHQGRPRVN